MADRLLDRLEDCTRSFPDALVLGGAGAQVLRRLGGGRAGVERATLVDTSPAMLRRAREQLGAGGVATQYVRADPGSELLPVDPGSFDGAPPPGARRRRPLWSPWPLQLTL